MCNLHDTIIFFMRHASLKLPSIHVYIRFYSTQKKDLSCTALASVHRIGLANCRRRSLTIMTSRTMRTQLHPSGTKASSGVFEDQEQRDFQKTFITQRVHCMCWHNARRYKNQYSFILDWRDFAHCDNILSAGSHHPDIFLPPFQSWQFVWSGPKSTVRYGGTAP